MDKAAAYTTSTLVGEHMPYPQPAAAGGPLLAAPPEEAAAERLRKARLQQLKRITVSEINSRTKLLERLETIAEDSAHMRELLHAEKHPHWWKMADLLDDVLDIYEALAGPLDEVASAQAQSFYK